MKPTLKSLAADVAIASKLTGDKLPQGWNQKAHAFKVTLTYRRRTMTTPFYQGLAHVHAPTAADVLECLLSDASVDGQSFEEWASDTGFDPDSRKAEKIYNACVSQTTKLKTLLGRDFQTFMGAER